MDEKLSPYIPLSWLRQQRKWAKAFIESGEELTDHDLWLWTTRLEIDRIVIQELRVENTHLRGEVSQLRLKLNTLLDRLNKILRESRHERKVISN